MNPRTPATVIIREQAAELERLRARINLLQRELDRAYVALTHAHICEDRP